MGTGALFVFFVWLLRRGGDLILLASPRCLHAPSRQRVGAARKGRLTLPWG